MALQLLPPPHLPGGENNVPPPPSPGEGGEEMGEDGGWPVPLRLRFAASVKAAELGEDILAESHNDMTLYC